MTDRSQKTETEAIPPDVAAGKGQSSNSIPPLPKKIGQYTIKRVIASGGMGVVYEAMQEKPRRTVALKVMKSGIVSTTTLRRFEYESQILARLQHPGIAQVYEAGTHDDGTGPVPYFAMEYIPNARSVTTYAVEKKLGTRERMQLFARVCDAVHHGHQKGIIHRDLKPGNILVSPQGQVKIIDFGVARSTDSDMALTTLQTDVGQLIGTLQYMSPEQCEADPHDIDIRSDVYALGVVQYELLCGRFPYEVKKKALHEVTRVIREEQPTRPSSVNKRLGSDVETIALKALEKERERRYQSAGELSRDVGHYLAGEPIEAKRDSGWYILKKLARRYRLPISAMLVVLLLGCAAIWSFKQYRQVHQTSMRQEWIASLRELPLRRDPPALKQAAAGVWDLVATGKATEEERRELISASVYFHKASLHRDIISLDDLRQSDEGYYFAIGYGGRNITPSKYGFIVSLEPRFDGSRVDGQLAPIHLQNWSSFENIRIQKLAVGSHLVSGIASVRFARITNSEEDIEASDGFEALDIPPVEIPIGPWRFTVVDEYPPDYPTMIADKEYSRQFADECRLEKVTFSVLERGRSGESIGGYTSWPFRDQYLDGNDGSTLADALQITLSFPIPPLEIACEAELNVPDCGLHLSLPFVVSPLDYDKQTFVVSSSESMDAKLFRDESRYILSIQYDVLQLFGARSPFDIVGSEMVLKIMPSRFAALGLSHIERYIGVNASGQVRITDTRDATRREAEKMVHALLGELLPPRIAVGRLEMEGEPSGPVRQMALQMARALSGNARRLNSASWLVVKSPGNAIVTYQRALRLVEDACLLDPDNATYLTTLGIAHYRVGSYREALETLIRSDQLNEGKGPADVAFIAMAHHHLGHEVEAQAALDRLRLLIDDTSLSNDVDAQDLLRQAESLVASEPASGGRVE